MTWPGRFDHPTDEYVRPFVVTGGRTHPVHDGLRIETIIYSAPAALSAPLRFEWRRIVEVCQAPRSVAEIAATLRVPLGVTRVLVADLISDGLVGFRQTNQLSVPVIERMLDRVRAL